MVGHYYNKVLGCRPLLLRGFSLQAATITRFFVAGRYYYEVFLCRPLLLRGFSLQAATTTRFFVAGRYYYEATVTDEGLCRVGWSTTNARLDLGTDREGFGFGGTGKKSFGRQFDTYGEVKNFTSHISFSVSCNAHVHV